MKHLHVIHLELILAVHTELFQSLQGRRLELVEGLVDGEEVPDYLGVIGFKLNQDLCCLVNEKHYSLSNYEACTSLLICNYKLD